MAGLLGGFRRAAPSSVHKMAVKPCCYGNTSVKLPPYPQTISIIPHPPISLPFHPVQQIEECQSAVWVSRRAKPDSALPQNDRAGWAVGRESGRKQCGGGQGK